MKAEIAAAKLAGDPDKAPDPTALCSIHRHDRSVPWRRSDLCSALQARTDRQSDVARPSRRGDWRLSGNERADHPGMGSEPIIRPKTIDIAFDFMRSGRPVDTYARARFGQAGTGGWPMCGLKPGRMNAVARYAAARGQFLMRGSDDN